MMTKQFEDKVAPVTVASQGIGAAMARLAGTGRCNGGAGLAQ
jgi:hypothetical protein